MHDIHVKFDNKLWQKQFFKKCPLFGVINIQIYNDEKLRHFVVVFFFCSFSAEFIQKRTRKKKITEPADVN